jgi:Animal haem peroxidase
VAAWVQFMIRDWFSHGPSVKDDPWEVEITGDDPWPEHPMRIMRTPRDPTRPDDATRLPPTFVNTETHWWDGSQIYGSDKGHQQRIRTGVHGKLRPLTDGPLPDPRDPDRDPAQVPGFWLGLAMMQNLFVLEHNAICDRLLRDDPNRTDEWLFQHARLINAALLAKIHTVEWTPVVISHPTTRFALPANWWGLAGERLHRLLGRISSSQAISGIPGSGTEHFGVPYAMTEEFVADYRMHPLLPDVYDFRSAADDGPLRELTLGEIAGRNALDVLAKIAMPDLLYSFGTIHPGLVTLHNYPRSLQTSNGRTAAGRWTWPRPTSCASASWACPATTSSAGCCTWHRPRTSSR